MNTATETVTVDRVALWRPRALAALGWQAMCAATLGDPQLCAELGARLREYRALVDGADEVWS